MTNSNWQKVKEVLDAALDLGPTERDVFLANACYGNDALRREVVSLLDAYRADFMEAPIATDDISDGGRLEAGTRIGHYKIIRKIGEGGMGEVYLAEDDRLDRKVAIKVLNEKYEDNESNIQRFIREAKAASALNHPNILVIHEIGETTNSHYIVSEFVDGKTLREILGETNLGLSRVLDIAIQISSALSAAHSAGIIHRDIKPENIVVRSDGYAKVLDFGLAKLITEPSPLIGIENAAGLKGQTAKGMILGTVSYMSPEQAKGEAVDERTDVFSLGVLIYEMLSGRTPFSAPSTPETLANLINKEPPDLSGLVSGIPDELNRIVGKTLKKEISERYDSVVSLAADLDSLKDRIKKGSLLDRTFEPESNKKTELLVKTTGDAIHDTHESRDRAKPSYRRLVLLTGTMLILLAALGSVWYRYQPVSTEQPHIRTLAVLPLRPIGGASNELGLGIADSIIRRISSTGSMIVRPTSAVRVFLTDDKDALTAGRVLGVDAVLDGTVQRDNDRLRISVNLLRMADGASIWTENFDMSMSDVFTIQDTVSQQIATQLHLKLDREQTARLTKRSTSNPIAFEYFLKGVYSFDQRGLGKKAKPQALATIDLFKKAVAADPQFAFAYAQLANIYAWLGVQIEPTDAEWSRLAREAIAAAEAIDPTIAETHLARSIMLAGPGEGWQTEAALRELLVAQKLDPNVAHNELADLYYHIGLENLADKEFEQAILIDPTSQITKVDIRYYYNNLRRYDELESAFRQYFPSDPIWSSYFIGKGRYQEAATTLESELEQSPEHPYLLARKAHLLALTGDPGGAKALVPRILKDADRAGLAYHHLMYEIACIFALTGNSYEAVNWLSQAAKTGYPNYSLFERDQYLDPIRKTPEFIQFMADLKPRFERVKREFGGQ